MLSLISTLVGAEDDVAKPHQVVEAVNQLLVVPDIPSQPAVNQHQLQHKDVGDGRAHSADVVGNPCGCLGENSLVVLLSALGHRSFSLGNLRVGLHRHLFGADFFDLGLSGKTSSSQRQLTLGLHLGQRQLVLLVSFALEIVQQFWQAGDQQATECRN